MSNVLLNTNILLYAIDEESKYFNSVQDILSDDSLKFFVTSKNISEFLSVITRIPNTGIPINEALLVVEKFKTAFYSFISHRKVKFNIYKFIEEVHTTRH